MEGRPATALALRDARLAAGLTQTEVARLADIPQGAIASYETGGQRLTEGRLTRFLDLFATAAKR